MKSEIKKHDWLGRVVGRYQIAEKLADGAHSALYWGRNLLEDDPDAAIKVVAVNDEDPFGSVRLHREGVVLSILNGTPASPKLIDRQFTMDGELVLVVELLDGMSLQTMLEHGDRRMGLAETITLFAPLVETLTTLHRRGIIHRNLHPGNVYRSWDPPALKLLGFGDATYVSSTFLQDNERFCGAPKYVAPEVWLGKANLDERSDVYSLAVVLFRCLTGRCPFDTDSSVELLHAVPQATRPSMVDILPELPAALDDWATIALSPEREGRFDNVEAMWTAFVRAAESPVENYHQTGSQLLLG